MIHITQEEQEPSCQHTESREIRSCIEITLRVAVSCVHSVQVVCQKMKALRCNSKPVHSPRAFNKQEYINSLMQGISPMIERAAYTASVPNFLAESNDSILGQLSQAQIGDLAKMQRDAWMVQIELLRTALLDHTEGTICFEYLIPRIGKRADNILLTGNTVIVLEFKVGAKQHQRVDLHQAMDYSLDLKNFHKGSQFVTIVPILIATLASDVPLSSTVSPDGVASAICANATNLRDAIRHAQTLGRGDNIDPQAWLNAGYCPTPTIIEASQALYRGNTVADITRSEAGIDNLGATTNAISKVIDQARATGTKAICLVTGVPGAGKTLAGLNLANERRRIDTAGVEHAVFLSGNGPLVRILQEALARDEVAQAKSRGVTLSKKDALRNAIAFIQNIHHFRDECVRNPGPPTERVVVFDEAQRAWNREQTSKFMQQKRQQPNFNQSEPAFLIGAMDRHQGWAVIVCLIGGGQEINTGEAGMQEWLLALKEHFPDWSIYVPEQIDSAEYLPTMLLEEIGNRLHRDASLHLGVSIRSFRSERLSSGIRELLSGSAETAMRELAKIQTNYEIRITRSLNDAKNWVRQKARGTERYGLLASSGARRLKAIGVFTGSMKEDVCEWFLEDDQDVRSSFYLEDAASEFEVQGLELDWAIVVWDGDFIRERDSWLYRKFVGTKWQQIGQEVKQQYRLNAYRVLLTRARQGLVIVVPEGDPNDETRKPNFYDPTWDYLQAVGLSELSTTIPAQTSL